MSLAGFDFTSHISQICVTISQTIPEFSHVDMSRVAVCFSQARVNSAYGIFASLTPLRFKDGAATTHKRGRQYQIQKVLNPTGSEMLYILTFFLPRFQNQTFREKLITIFHELWHISPSFNGDIRRHAGRCYAHTGSQAAYDAHMGQLVDAWLQSNAFELTMLSFLEHNFQQLTLVHGGVFGTKISRPKMIPLAS
jgi:Putative phage metallopeptidase